MFELAFPTGRDSATFRDKGTEISSLSRDEGTTGHTQNLATGRDGPGQCQNLGRDAGRDDHYFSVKIRDGTGTGRDGTIAIFLMISCFRTFFSALSRFVPRPVPDFHCPGPSRPGFWLSRPVPSRGKILSLSRCPFVPGQ